MINDSQTVLNRISHSKIINSVLNRQSSDVDHAPLTHRYSDSRKSDKITRKLQRCPHFRSFYQENL